MKAHLLLTSAAVFILGSSAHAQSASVAQPDSANAASTTAQGGQSSASNAGGLEEIVVTANKRTQNINNVGQTITAISGNVLASHRIESLADLAAEVPGLTFAQSSKNTPILTLRGVGYNDDALGVYPAVSAYVDEVPLPFPVMTSHSAYDLKRVEVLKGPQGILFGENSTGGAINYIAAKPTDVYAAGGDISYGRFNDVSSNLYVSGPIASNLKGRIAVNGEHMDAWQKSNSRDESLGQKRYFAGRILLDWEPTPGTRFELNLNGWIDKSDPQALQYIALNPQAPAFTTPVLAQARFSPQTPRAADWTPGLPFSDRKFGQVALRSDIDLTESVRLTSLTSYDYLKQEQATDQDGLPLQIFDVPVNNGHIDSFNQELRIANSDEGAFRWLVGGNFESSHVVERQLGQFGDGTNSNPADLFIFQGLTDTDQSFRNYAFFGNGEYNVTSALTIKAGLRYTNTRDQAKICDLDAGDGRVNALFTAVANGEQSAQNSGIVVPPINQGQCYSINSRGFPIISPLMATLQQHNVSWRIGADYKIRPGFLLYANVSGGYKAGSFPTILASNTFEFQPVTQEEVTAYESGFKASLADHRVQIDGAVFYDDYSDKQVHGRVNIPPFGPLDALVNVPKSRIYGAELEGTIRPLPGLSASAGVTYLATEVLDYTGFNVQGRITNFRGDPLPSTPKWTYNASVDYRFPELGRGTPFIGATVIGRSSEDAVLGGGRITLPGPPFATAPGIKSPFLINGYATLDLRAGYESDEDDWRVMIWGKNVFNKYYWTNVVAQDDSIARFAGMPATFGVTLSFKM